MVGVACVSALGDAMHALLWVSPHGLMGNGGLVCTQAPTRRSPHPTPPLRTPHPPPPAVRPRAVCAPDRGRAPRHRARRVPGGARGAAAAAAAAQGAGDARGLPGGAKGGANVCVCLCASVCVWGVEALLLLQQRLGKGLAARADCLEVRRGRACVCVEGRGDSWSVAAKGFRPARGHPGGPLPLPCQPRTPPSPRAPLLPCSTSVPTSGWCWGHRRA